MQLNRSTDIAEFMAGEAPGLSGHCGPLDSVEIMPRNGVPIWKFANNNISIQTGEEFSMKFLQECSASRSTAVDSVAPNCEEKIGVPNVQNRQMVYEELARVLGLSRMDSECGSDITEFASARGSTTQIDNGVYSVNGSMNYLENGADGHKLSKSTSEVCTGQTCVLPTVPLLSESESSKSLGASDGSKIGKLKLLCSFGGKILPRPSDGKLRYVGGETRMISIRNNLSLEGLMKKTAGMSNQPHSIKYQLPGEDLDALISVSSDEDLQNMIDEYHGLDKPEGSQRLRIFLIPLNDSETSITVDTSLIQKSDTNYQYVAAVNGIAETDPNPPKYYNGQSSASDNGQLIPNAESNPRYEKVFPFPVHPLGIKDSLGGESETLYRPLSTRPFPVQKADPKNAMATIQKSNSPLSSIEGSSLFSILPLPPEDSPCYSASSYHNPRLDVNLMKSPGPLDKHDVVQPNMKGQIILEGENFTPERLEQNNNNFVLCSQEGVPIMKKAVNLEAPFRQPDHSVGILPGFSNPVSCYHGMPHAFSDPQLQEQGEKSPYASQEDMSRSFSLNLGRPQSSSYRVQLHENVDFNNIQLQSKALIADPTVPVSGIALMHSPVASESLRKFEAKDVSCTTVGKGQLDQNLKLKPQDNDCMPNLELMNTHGANGYPFSSGEFFRTSKSPVISQELTKGLENVNFEPGPRIFLDSPKEESQSSSSLAPASSLLYMTELELKQTQKNHLQKTSIGFTKVNPESYSSPTANSEVAGLTHSSQKLSHDNSSNAVLLPNGLVSPQIISSQSIEGSGDIGGHEFKVSGCVNTDGPTGVGIAGWSNIHHNSALFEREVSLLDGLSHSNNWVEKSNYIGICNEHQNLKDDLVIDSIEQGKHKPVNNLSPAECPPCAVPDVSDADNVKTLSTCEESENTLQNLDSEAIFSLLFNFASFKFIFTYTFYQVIAFD